MLTIEEMLMRLVVAIVLGAIVGFERELVGKSAGVRTDILVAAGAAMFTIIGLELPYVAAISGAGVEHLQDIVATSRGFTVIAGIVTGIGFLGAGVILKEGPHVTGVTTAASIWFVAAVGILSGVGLIEFAAIAAVGLVFLLFLLRKLDLYGLLNKKERMREFNEDGV